MATTYVQTAAWNTAGTVGTGGCYKEVTVGTVAVGDQISAWGACANYDTVTSPSRAVTTAPSSVATMTWGTATGPTTVVNAHPDVIHRVGIVATAGTLVVRVQVRANAATHMGAGVWWTPAAEVVAGYGVLGGTFVNDADGQVARDPGVNSTIWYMGADWNAIGQTTTPGTPGTNITYSTRIFDSGQYSIFAAQWVNQASGSRSYGPSGLSGAGFSGLVFRMDTPSGGGPATFSTTVGDATADGGAVEFEAAAAFVTATGDATADGGSTNFSAPGVFSTIVGSATADGGGAEMEAAAAFITAAGAATADGGSTTFSAPGVFSTSSGDATADGSSATFTAGTTPATFSTTAGDATADGGSTSFTAAATFGALVGSATADGGVAEMEAAAAFGALVGSATADGGSTTFVAGASSTFVGLAGDATADGNAASFTAAATFGSLVGGATADGGSTSFTAAATFSALVGSATADGGSTTFAGGAVSTFATLAGDATADGGAVTFRAAAAFVANVGVALAEGGLAYFGTAGTTYTPEIRVLDITPGAGTLDVAPPERLATLSGGHTLVMAPDARTLVL